MLPIITHLGSRMAAGRAAVLAVTMAALLAGCGSSQPATITASDPAFSGLDPVVVGEVLSSPTAQRNASYGISGQAERDSLYQGMVRDYVECRNGYAAYTQWRRLGIAPKLALAAIPTHPIEPSNADMVSFRKQLEKAVASGDPDELMKVLSGEGACGEAIPAKPGDISGPTISQALKSAA